MDKTEVKLSFDGQEIGFSNAELKIDKTEVVNNLHSETYEGTLEDVKFSEEFLLYIEKQRKLLKIKKREKIYTNL